MKTSKWLMIGGSLLLLSLFVFPMWQITLRAPQYPDGLGLNIWINKMEGKEPGHIQNINLMNHYVGMAYLPEKMKEFEIFPVVILSMTALGLIVGFIGRRKLYLTWFVLMSILGCIGMYDFYKWEYEYGHNLDPKAPIKIPGQAYQPPLIGKAMILNFEAVSMPHVGGYLLFLGMGMAVVAFYVDKKQEEKEA